MSDDHVVGVCPICRRNVYFMETHYIDNGIDFHESCYVKHLCYIKSKLDKRKSKGNITLDEAKDLQDTEQILINVMSDKEENHKEHMKKNKYDCLVCKPLIREDCYRSNINRNIKRLEESRNHRWAFEALNSIDNKFLLSAIEDKKQLSDGETNDTMQT